MHFDRSALVISFQFKIHSAEIRRFNETLKTKSAAIRISFQNVSTWQTGWTVTRAAFKTRRNLALIHRHGGLIRESRFSPPIAGSVRNEVRYFISIQSECILVKIGHGARLARRTSGPCAHPQGPRCPSSPPPPGSCTNRRDSFFRVVFLSWLLLSWPLQHNSSRRHEHKYYDRLLFMRHA